MRRIAILNQKGGVGKTTTTVNLAAALARLGYAVHVFDMDPQAHATLHLGIDPTSLKASMYEVLTGNASLKEARVRVEPNLEVVGSHIDLAAAEVELVGVVGREVILRDLIKAEYGAADKGTDELPPAGSELFVAEASTDRADFILMDCPPSLGILTLNALTAATEVIIPLQPHFLALHGMSKLLETIALVQRRINRDLRVRGIVLCMVDSNTRLAAEVEADLRQYFSRCDDPRLPWYDAVIFETRIRRNIRLAECPSHGKSILDYAPSSNGAQDYFDLALEVVRLGPPADDPAISQPNTAGGLADSLPATFKNPPAD